MNDNKVNKNDRHDRPLCRHDGCKETTLHKSGYCRFHFRCTKCRKIFVSKENSQGLYCPECGTESGKKKRASFDEAWLYHC